MIRYLAIAALITVVMLPLGARLQAAPSSLAPAAPLQQATPAAAPTPLPQLAPAPILRGTLVTSTLHLDLYQLKGALEAETIAQLAPQFEQAVATVGERMSGRLIGRVAIRFEPAQTGQCAIRGITMSHDRYIRLFYGPNSDPQAVLAVVAHELAHEHQHDYYGWKAHRKSDNLLLEGQATWASGGYSLGEDGRPTWLSAAEQANAEGTMLPLTTNLESDCRRATRNSAYTGWASFVTFLIETYGRERFDAVYRSGTGRAPASANYRVIYGKRIGELEREWREWLGRGSKPA